MTDNERTERVKVEVTQADRDAARSFTNTLRGRKLRAESDLVTEELAPAFARHRLFAIAALRAQGRDERAEIVAWARGTVANALWRGVDFADAIEAGEWRRASTGGRAVADAVLPLVLPSPVYDEAVRQGLLPPGAIRNEPLPLPSQTKPRQ